VRGRHQGPAKIWVGLPVPGLAPARYPSKTAGAEGAGGPRLNRTVSLRRRCHPIQDFLLRGAVKVIGPIPVRLYDSATVV